MKDDNQIYNQINEIYHMYYDINDNDELLERINIIGSISNIFNSISSWLKRNFSSKVSKIQKLADEYEQALYNEYKSEYIENDSLNYSRAYKFYYQDLKVSTNIEQKIDDIVGNDKYYEKLAKNLLNQKQLNVKNRILEEMKKKIPQDSPDYKKVDDLSDKVNEKKKKFENEYDILLKENEPDIKIYQEFINNIIKENIKSENFLKIFSKPDKQFDENKCYSFLLMMIKFYKISSEFQKNNKNNTELDYETFKTIYKTFIENINKIYNNYLTTNIEIISYNDIINNVVKLIETNLDNKSFSKYTTSTLFNEINKNINKIYQQRYQELLDKGIITKATSDIINIDNRNINNDKNINKKDKIEYTNTPLSVDDIKDIIAKETNKDNENIKFEDIQSYIKDKINEFYEKQKDLMIENINATLLEIQEEDDENKIQGYKILNENYKDINITVEKNDEWYKYIKNMITEDFPQIAGTLYFQKIFEIYKNNNNKNLKFVIFGMLCDYLLYILLAKITKLENIKNDLSQKISKKSIDKIQKYLDFINQKK